MPRLEEPEWVFPFVGMGVGDSFFVPTVKISEMIYLIDTGAKKEGMKVKAYATVKDGCIGVRAWRVR